MLQSRRFGRGIGGFLGFRGFTLVEMLVCIAIIAVLLGMLLPTLTKAKRGARVLQCATNLRQINFAWRSYLNDNDGWFPEWSKNLQWFYGGNHPAIANEPDKLGKLAKDDRLLNPYISGRERQERRALAFRCPFDREIRDAKGQPAVTAGHTTWDYFGNSYMLNWNLIYRTPPGQRFAPPMASHIGMLRHGGSRTVLLGDCQWYYIINDAPWDANFHDRGDRVNLGFIDGHVEETLIRRGHTVGPDYAFDLSLEDETP